jgi:tRNA(Arg) A34 adenosine deaminase TadA
MKSMTPELYNRLCDVIENNILPLTSQMTLVGNKIFGAAVLLKKDLSLILASTNHEAFSPLWHGEVYCIKQFFEKQGHPDPKDCIFLATHEPCCMCTSSIAWSGFDEVYYLFGYDLTGGEFNIPHDQKMIRDIFGCKEPNHDNSYFKMFNMVNEANKFNEEEKKKALDRYEKIRKKYAVVSEQYQKGEKKMILK